MDYKEKYEKALEWMKSIYPTMQGSDKEDAEHYFPELAESEDEKIRKVLIHIVKSACSKYGIKYIGDKITEEMLLAYIERQKEQKPVENSGKELLYVSNKSYNVGYRDGKREAEQKTAKWSEEDEEMLDAMIDIVSNSPYEPLCPREGMFAWLKSLRPTHWKPSKEQMYSLGSVVNGAGEATEGSIAYHLKELYEQLKKL